MLRKYRESLRISWGYNDYNDWPIRVTSIMHLFTDVMSEQFLQDLDTLWSEEEGARVLADAFRYPGRLFRLIDIILFGLRRNRIPLDEQRLFTIRMLKAAECLKTGDLFNSDGRNLLRDVSLPQKQELEQGSGDLVHKLQAALFMYTETILFRGHDAAKTVHGPYITQDNTQLVFREYYNLRPGRLWSDSLLIDADKITTICEYDSAADVRVDCLDHIYHTGSLRENLISWKVIIDGEAVCDTGKLRQLTEQVLAKAAQVNGIVEDWDWRQKAKKYAEIFWFRKAPLRARIGLATEPPEWIYARIDEGKPHDARQRCLTPKEIDLLIRLGV